jgi:hypothetical protein
MNDVRQYLNEEIAIYLSQPAVHIMYMRGPIENRIDEPCEEARRVFDIFLRIFSSDSLTCMASPHQEQITMIKSILSNIKLVEDCDKN